MIPVPSDEAMAETMIKIHPTLKKLDFEILTELIKELNDDQKLKKFVEFLDAEFHDNLEIDEISNITLTECYEVEALRIETFGDQDYYLIFDDSNLEKNLTDALLDDPFWQAEYCESIKSDRVNPVSTTFKDYIEEMVDFDFGSLMSSYDSAVNELSGNTVWFRAN